MIAHMTAERGLDMHAWIAWIGPRLVSGLGLVTMLLLAWLASEDRRRMNFRLILSGLALQIVLAALLLATPLKSGLFYVVTAVMDGFISCSDEGAKFVFGEDFREHYFAFSVMPTVIVFSSLTAILFYLGVLQWIVKLMARVMVWVMDVSGSESLCAAANVFVGMTTAPLVIRPYLQTMTRSELMAMMTGGMATVAGGTMVAYVGMARQADPTGPLAGQLAGHLAVASLISAPASLVIAKIMVPETEDSPTKGRVKIDVPRTDANLLDAACRGAGEGLKLVLNIVAMLIAFIALVHLVNLVLSGSVELVDGALVRLGITETDHFLVRQVLGGEPLTLERMLGWLCAPLAWIMGVEWKDAATVGTLIGEKTIFNEFIAYDSLLTEHSSRLSERSFTIATYALCGFANLGSIAVTIGGISGLAPDRRRDFAKYGFRALIGGSLAAFTTASIAGMLMP
jgi:CNT family concentrative nucleoside transporter